MIIPYRTCMSSTSYLHQLLTQHFKHYWMQCLLQHKSSTRKVQVQGNRISLEIIRIWRFHHLALLPPKDKNYGPITRRSMQHASLRHHVVMVFGWQFSNIQDAWCLLHSNLGTCWDINVHNKLVWMCVKLCSQQKKQILWINVWVKPKPKMGEEHNKK